MYALVPLSRTVKMGQVHEQLAISEIYLEMLMYYYYLCSQHTPLLLQYDQCRHK